jgi:hypothetical protein
MPAPKGNKNALKHGLYASHIPMDVLPELARMPIDSGQMELAALRFTALRAIDLYSSAKDQDDKAVALDIAIRALKAVVNILAKEKILVGDAPILKDLWAAIEEANCLDGLDKDI